MRLPQTEGVSPPHRLLDTARRLAPAFRVRALESEHLRTLAPDLVEAVHQAGLFTLALPKALGGHECDPFTIIEVVEELSRADGSAGWTVLIGTGTCFLAWLKPDIARGILAENPHTVIAGQMAPVGRAVADASDGTYTVSGRWAFNSGCPHSNWFLGGVVVLEQGEPRVLAGGRPDWRFALFPASQARIIDTWHVAGLKGTGSHDIEVVDIAVPHDHTMAPFFEPAYHDGPLYRLSFFNLLMVLMAGFPLGVARRAIEEFCSLAQQKSRTPSRTTLGSDPAIWIQVAEAEATLQAARAFVFEAVGEAWEAVQRGDATSLQQRVRVVMAVQHAVRSAVAVATTMFHLAGGGALYESSPLQRCFRDVHAAGQHIAFSLETSKRLGAALLGQDVERFLL
jgi:alkylation response protein AidB-like acyl-CoA dehydrogenase